MTSPNFESDFSGWKRRFWLAIGAYVVILTVAIRWLNTLETVPFWAGPLAVLVCLLPAGYALASGAILTERHDGLERSLLHRSTSIAFFVTMVTCVTLGLMEGLTRTGPISAWVIYTVGMLTWVVAHKRLATRLA